MVRYFPPNATIIRIYKKRGRKQEGRLVERPAGQAGHGLKVQKVEGKITSALKSGFNLMERLLKSHVGKQVIRKVTNE